MSCTRPEREVTNEVDAIGRTKLLNACYDLLPDDEHVPTLPIHEMNDNDLNTFYFVLRSMDCDVEMELGF